MTKHHLALSFLLLAPLCFIQAQQTNTNCTTGGAGANPVVIEVDCAQTVRTFAKNPTGFCMSFLNDADATNRPSLSPVMKSMKVGSLRFPGGTMAENYLFHDLSKGSPAEGHLQPRAIVPDKVPGRGKWVQPDGSFTPDDAEMVVRVLEWGRASPAEVMSRFAFGTIGAIGQPTIRFT